MSVDSIILGLGAWAIEPGLLFDPLNMSQDLRFGGYTLRVIRYVDDSVCTIPELTIFLEDKMGKGSLISG